MFPISFFIILVVVISYLLIVTHPRKQSLVVASRDKWKRFQKAIRVGNRN
ncbi:MAG: hypothetical protein ABIN57_00605 [Chitinophagaceae bacterium]